MPNTKVSTLIFKAFTMVAIIIFIYGWIKFSSKKNELPIIQGIVLAEEQVLKAFLLQSTNKNIFNIDKLKGHWTIISYGYTHCPDICPTTLMTLSSLLNHLDESNQKGQLNAIFYSIDAKRDSIKILTQYTNYFSQDITPLRAKDKSMANIFEQQLGIQVQYNENKATNTYEVAHSVSMLLINPNAALQAVILPNISNLGIEHFEEQQLYIDFLKVRYYYETK
ncbi:MAG: protein SCO1/2 [Psychroserpens sp.]|jgi:protein SCO1/2